MSDYKEYLIPDNGGYRVAVQDAGLPIAEDWIEIPEGADKYIRFEEYNNANFYKVNFDAVWQDDGYWDYDMDDYKTYCKKFGVVLWQRPTQPEALPFIDDNPQSLNDQYAEIEQVRQQTIERTLAERQSTYGNFEDVAFVTENIMAVLSKVRTNGLSELPHTHRMALYMIASKMARIVNGDFNHLDSWHDIGGYSKLIEKLIKGE